MPVEITCELTFALLVSAMEIPDKYFSCSFVWVFLCYCFFKKTFKLIHYQPVCEFQMLFHNVEFCRGRRICLFMQSSHKNLTYQKNSIAKPAAFLLSLGGLTCVHVCTVHLAE